MPTGDEALVKAAREGSSAAIGDLFDRHWPRAWRVAHAITGVRDHADDIAQDSFMRAITGLEGYDGRRPFGAWLERIVVNRSIDVLRRERRHVPLEHAAELVAPADGGAVDPELRRALRRLPPDRRAVVILHYWLGYPLGEVALLLGVPEGTVHSRLARALTALRRDLGVSADG